MTAGLIVHRAGPGQTIQDGGRPGYLAFGLPRGGAADRLALAEGAALLGQSADLAALEMPATGGVYEATVPLRIALTGAPMRATIGDDTLAWNAVHSLPQGARLTIGGASAGVYGYLHVGGGFATPTQLGARATHMGAGIGTAVQAGKTLPVGPDADGGRTGVRLDVEDRFHGGEVRMVPSLQTGFFADAEIARFQGTAFRRDARGNRMGVRLLPDGAGFHSEAGLSILSEVIVPGDIQVTGDGTPFVLLADCQTTGGYPRIGSVLPCDLPRVAQAPPGATLRFRLLTLDDATEAERQAAKARGALHREVVPLLRDPASIRDLLAYQLISGVTAGRDKT